MRVGWRRGRTLAAALAASAGLHLAVLAFLVLSSDPPAAPPPPPPVEITLFRAPASTEPPVERAPTASRQETAPLSATEPEREARMLPRRSVRPSPGVLPISPGSLAPATAAAPGPPPPPRTAPSPTGAPPRGVPPELGRALRASGCDPFSRDATERERCRERVAATRNTPRIALSAAQAAAEDAERAARVRIPGSEGYQNRSPPCREPCVRFGYIPPASPVIPPSTLRGDDDALRPKPRP